MGGGFAKNATLTSASAEVRHCGSKTSAAMGGGFAPSGFRHVPNPGQLRQLAPVPI
jgi:hypothetical protein